MDRGAPSVEDAIARLTQSVRQSSARPTTMTAVTPTHVVIRAARPIDADAIGEVHAEAWRVGYRHIFSREDLTRLVEQRRTDRWPTAFADPGFSETTLLVALRSGIVGFVHFGPSRAGPDHVGEIYSFNVHPDEWGSGAAAALMQEACDKLSDRGNTTIRLWTYQDAGRARRFYEKTGFQPTGHTKQEGPDGGPTVTEVEYSHAIPHDR